MTKLPALPHLHWHPRVSDQQQLLVNKAVAQSRVWLVHGVASIVGEIRWPCRPEGPAGQNSAAPQLQWVWECVQAIKSTCLTSLDLSQALPAQDLGSTGSKIWWLKQPLAMVQDP